MTRWNLAIVKIAVLAFGLWDSTARAYPLPPVEVPPFSSAEAIKEINRYRALAKVGAWEHDNRLEQSAILHSRYLTENIGCDISHDESNTKSSFYRGASPRERIKKVMPDETYTSELASVMMSSGKPPSDWRERIQGLLDAPFHRTDLLGNFVKAGVTVSNCTQQNSKGLQMVVNMATESKLDPEDELVVWPNDGDTNTPIDWYGFESPLPMPYEDYGKLTGYPITLQSVCYCVLLDLDFQLTSAESNKFSPGNRLTKDDGYLNYGAESFLSRYYRGIVIFVPKKPLLLNHYYKVVVTGYIADYFKPEKKRPFRKEWQFKTLGAEPLAFTLSPNKTDLEPGESIDVTLTGGTRNYRSPKGYSFQTSYGYRLGVSCGTEVDKGETYQIEVISDRHYRITNSVNSKLKCRTLSFTAYDSSNATIQQTINLH